MGQDEQNAHPQPEEIIMFRKISFALIAAAALGSAALAPTSASAWGRGGFHEGGFHDGYRGGWEHRGFGYGYGYGFDRGSRFCNFHPCEIERPL
jgi:hypothetical protein